MPRMGRDAMVHAVLDGKLDGIATRTDPVFGLAIPQSVPGVPNDVLDPRGTWNDPAAYDAQAKKLAAMFRTNFEKFSGADARVKAAGPQG